MCGRYYVDMDDTELADIVFSAEESCADSEKPPFAGGEVFPGMQVPVLSERGAEFMLWGYPLPWKKHVAAASDNENRPLINARSETAAEKRTFRDAWENRRCLIPASGYFEWKDTGAKRKEKYAFALSERGVMYLAGLYNKDGEFAILTREAAPEVAEIHGRMPVIIPKELARVWLRDTPEVTVEAVTDVVAEWVRRG
ncbi:MAG: SOS response-associated peptidase [Oscillospiraceae bacterium]|jgi:putative SOS response-associated peptidase YedK|nr:SOS response-associated peptidase [Oscillospiraceae bacterium]